MNPTTISRRQGVPPAYGSRGTKPSTSLVVALVATLYYLVIIVWGAL